MTCHYCEHPSRRNGRCLNTGQIACENSVCKKVYCSTKLCSAKLAKHYPQFADFDELRADIHSGSYFFICPHCLFPEKCLGRQCKKKRAIGPPRDYAVSLRESFFDHKLSEKPGRENGGRCADPNSLEFYRMAVKSATECIDWESLKRDVYVRMNEEVNKADWNSKCYK